MSVELSVRLHKRFTLRTLLQRTRELSGLGEDVAMQVMTPEAFRRSAPPLVATFDLLELACGPGVAEQPEPAVRLAVGDGVTDLVWVDTSDVPDPESGVWLFAYATWRNEASLLLCTYVAIAAAQLGHSVIVDESSLLGRGRLVPPETLFEALERASDRLGGAPGSEAYAAAVLTQVRGRAGR